MKRSTLILLLSAAFLIAGSAQVGPSDSAPPPQPAPALAADGAAAEPVAPAPLQQAVGEVPFAGSEVPPPASPSAAAADVVFRENSTAGAEEALETAGQKLEAEVKGASPQAIAAAVLGSILLAGILGGGE
ncbi:hypothetical protein Rsub_10272 [Raphidocelis subcapitata]|uniref:Uncharacterized protein n=1 Tax=Raphidocelis subcapitata TaxID=307507 RepID=A0A2V0PDX0_9CHLO|nr:hypothetical protein Rsub_10272 [Raphidocelis subcapitata]|eukprot:GBF98044.1 hypothetical protein Rsub_10272 [Raphidocelis subcapitata]